MTETLMAEDLRPVSDRDDEPMRRWALRCAFDDRDVKWINRLYPPRLIAKGRKSEISDGGM